MSQTTAPISREVRDWLTNLARALPASAPRVDGTQVARHDFIDTVEFSFAHLMSTGPNYNRGVVRHVQQAVRWFAQGDGDMVDTNMCGAFEAKDNR